MLWSSWILEKLHFSLICSFYCCLMKEGYVLKVAKQFAVPGLVAYKPIAYKKTKCNLSSSTFTKVCFLAS